MNEVRETIRKLLLSVAPEAAEEEIAPDVDLREQLDIDSMDHLRFLVAVSEEFGIAIPEKDYPELVTLDGCARYVERHRQAGG